MLLLPSDLYIYISPEVTLTIEDLNFRQFLDTQTGIISQTYTLTNRFKSVILINYQEDSLTPLKYKVDPLMRPIG